MSLPFELYERFSVSKHLVMASRIEEDGAKAREILEVHGLEVGDDLPLDYEQDAAAKMKAPRRCGILVHPTSFPGNHAIGEFGLEARKFLDWLHESGCSVWQVLPLGPPGDYDMSPYFGTDANCGNILLLSLQELVEDGLLEEEDVPKAVPVGRMDGNLAKELKFPALAKASQKLVSGTGEIQEEFESFKRDPKIAVWLEDSALFKAIEQDHGYKVWWDWPVELRDRHVEALEEVKREKHDFIEQFMAAQFLFQRQWQRIHKYANSLGINIVGDMAIYVGPHSTDVWAHRTMFELDPNTGIPTVVSGVPADGFCTEGQLWGSPLYNWKEMAKDGYRWWINRMLRAYDLYDEFRMDHFRGLAGYWAIENGCKSALDGKWRLGPRMDFFNAIENGVGKLTIMAEDLGIITKDVVALRKQIQAPGMVVLQFAFNGKPANIHLPHNHEIDLVVYTGTHDNETIQGWWNRTDDVEKARVREYYRFEGDRDVHWELIRSAMASVGQTAIIPLQDVLGLGNECRMNDPGTTAWNWQWRIGGPDAFSKLEVEKKRLMSLIKHFNRIPPQKKVHTVKAFP